jgi:preprotein translocase SecE subunit
MVLGNSCDRAAIGAAKGVPRDADRAARSCVFLIGRQESFSFMSKPLARVGTFLTGVREELRQTSWPTRDELIGSTLVVFVGVVLLASFIGVCDLLLSQAAQWLLR